MEKTHVLKTKCIKHKKNTKNRARSVMVPGGLRVQFFKICGQTDSVEIDIDNRANPGLSVPASVSLPSCPPGHQLCMACATAVNECPICRKPVTLRTRFYS